MCSSPDANRSDSSWMTLLSHCIPRWQRSGWRCEAKQQQLFACSIKWCLCVCVCAYQRLAVLCWAQRGSWSQRSPHQTGKRWTETESCTRKKDIIAQLYSVFCVTHTYVHTHTHLQIAQIGQQGFCLCTAETGAPFRLPAELRTSQQDRRSSYEEVESKWTAGWHSDSTGGPGVGGDYTPSSANICLNVVWNWLRLFGWNLNLWKTRNVCELDQTRHLKLMSPKDDCKIRECSENKRIHLVQRWAVGTSPMADGNLCLELRLGKKGPSRCKERK